MIGEIIAHLAALSEILKEIKDSVLEIEVAQLPYELKTVNSDIVYSTDTGSGNEYSITPVTFPVERNAVIISQTPVRLDIDINNLRYTSNTICPFDANILNVTPNFVI